MSEKLMRELSDWIEEHEAGDMATTWLMRRVHKRLEDLEGETTYMRSELAMHRARTVTGQMPPRSQRLGRSGNVARSAEEI